MPNYFRFIVDVECTRDQGKFASREELAQQLIEALEQADPSNITGENGGEYSINWEVNETVLPKRPRRARRTRESTPAE